MLIRRPTCFQFSSFIFVFITTRFVFRENFFYFSVSIYFFDYVTVRIIVGLFAFLADIYLPLSSYMVVIVIFTFFIYSKTFGSIYILMLELY